MSYPNQSDKDHLDIILGPPGQDELIDSVHYYATVNDITIDEAWSESLKNTADNLMKPTAGGFNSFTNIFSDVLKEEVHVNDYFLSQYYRCFSTNGQFLRKLNKEDRHDSDEEELKKEQKDLRNYDFLRGKHE